MNSPCVVHWHGEQLWLLPEKAIFWPAWDALLIADAHFGKAAAYRRLGQPVPRGTTAQTLTVLDHLLAQYKAHRLIFLGDFLHGPGSHAPATMAALHEWRSRHRRCDMLLIRGNHDRRAGDPPESLAIERCNEPFALGPFDLRHEPAPEGRRPAMAGHLHPVFRLKGRGRQRLRLPCFLFNHSRAMLPAFGSFTGGMEIEPAPGDQLYLAGAGQVWPIINGGSRGS